MKEVKFCDIEGLIVTLKVTNAMWHWLCENYPQIALEYEKSLEVSA